MERTKLKAARVALGLSRPQLADEIGCSSESIGDWERGDATPHFDMIRELCKFFGKNPADLDLASDLTEREFAMLQEILKNKKVNRRQTLALMALPAFAGVDFSASEKPLRSPDAFLSQCNAAISGCWHLLKHGDFVPIGSILMEYLPELSDLVIRSSDMQQEAAVLASQAQILQALLAGHRLDYVARGAHCAKAVRLGEISGDSRIYTAAMYWHADTFIYCSHQPKKAVPILKDALASLGVVFPEKTRQKSKGTSPLLTGGDDVFINKSALCFNLAIAYAKDKDEKDKDKIIEIARQARQAMPKYPELEPLHQCVDIGPSGLYRYEGRLYLYLAERYPGEDYAEKAHKAFCVGVSKQEGNRTLCQTLIHRASAARELDDLRGYMEDLEQGATLAFQIKSQKRQEQARKVLAKASDTWKKERRYKNLAKMF